ncbi:bone morphogenetic protein 7 [Microplitis demolitor]|uniref:bone morphogenetic protein 7 n=1 Tax=Microplitis demolitor TaxID=69319 RepID=UPI00235B5BB5|nr:bone morphogenetic protein 7 [Microplitis demolitor]
MVIFKHEKSSIEFPLKSSNGYSEFRSSRAKKDSATYFLESVYSQADYLERFDSMNYNYGNDNLTEMMITCIVARPFDNFYNHNDQFSGEILWFNVTKMSQNTLTLESAELYLYKNITSEDKRICESVKIEVYQKLCKTGDNNKFVDSLLVSPDDTDWLTFNVTEPIKSWIDDPKKNNGLNISIVPFESCTHESLLKLQDIGISGLESSADIEFKPFLVLYFHNVIKGQHDMKIKQNVRNKRDDYSKSQDYESNEIDVLPPNYVTSNPFTKTYKRKFIDNHRTVKKNLADYNNDGIKKKRSNCNIKSLPFNFEDIGRDYIIAPKIINFSFCNGQCDESNFDNSTYSTAYNHYLIYESLRHLYPKEISSTYCIPTTFSNLTTLFFDINDNIVLKVVPNIIAEECSCE